MMLRFLLPLLCLPLLAAAAAAAPTVTVRARTVDAPRQFSLEEWAVRLGTEYANPFDPGEISVDAVFTGPKGQKLMVPAFWYQDYRRETDGNGERLTAQGSPEWRLRF